MRCLALLLGLVVLLTGCSSQRSVNLGPKDFEQPDCAGYHEIRVEDLSVEPAEQVDCVPIGSMLVFPDGHQVEIIDGTIGFAQGGPASDTRYTVMTFDDFGVAAGMKVPGRAVRWWGSTAQAIRFGKYLSGP